MVAAVAAFATFMTACGNDSSSGVTKAETKGKTFTGEPVTRTAFTGEPVTFSTPGTYTVNKEKQLIA